MSDRGRDLKPPEGITTNAFLKGRGTAPIMKFDFSGQVAIVTGAAGNLGAAVARAFRSAGAKLALIDLSSERFPNLFPDLAQSPDCFFAPATNSGDPGAVAQTVDEIKRRFGRIDILVNTVGGYRAGPPYTKRRWVIGSSCSI